MPVRTIFALAVASGLAQLLLLVWVPAQFRFHSQARTLVPQLAVNIPYYLLGARALLLWRGHDRMPAPWSGVRGAPRTQFHVCGAFFVTPVTIVMCLLQAVWACESNPGCPLLAASPCGASSCSRQTDLTSVVYSAAGFFWSAVAPYTNFAPTTCMYTGCAWGDGNGRNVTGYPPRANDTGSPDLAEPPCAGQDPACIATTRAQDYPNPAIGVGGGYRPGFEPGSIARVTTCPGTVVLVGVDATRLAGRECCSYCLPFFRKHMGYVNPATAYCPQVLPDEPGAEDNFFTCAGLCPQLGEDRSPFAMLKQSLSCNASVPIPTVTWALVECAAYAELAVRAVKRRGKAKQDERRPPASVAALRAEMDAAAGPAPAAAAEDPTVSPLSPA